MSAQETNSSIKRLDKRTNPPGISKEKLSGVVDAEARKIFETANAIPWKLAFEDDGTKDLTEKWFKDGEKATVENTPEGMVYTSGQEDKDAESHTVLWTKDSFVGHQMKVEFDFVRLDEAFGPVCLLYMFATTRQDGYSFLGELSDENLPYDIYDWKDKRTVAHMGYYFQNMNLYSISFATGGVDPETGEHWDGVRGRRYPTPKWGKFNPDTLFLVKYQNTGMFKKGKTYHLSFIKGEEHLMLKVVGEGEERIFHWPLNEFEVPVKDGRVGIRQMYTRISRYSNLKISLPE